jgi:hypothetical protein
LGCVQVAELEDELEEQQQMFHNMTIRCNALTKELNDTNNHLVGRSRAVGGRGVPWLSWAGLHVT